MAANIPQVRVPQQSDRYDTEAACQTVCDALTAQIDAAREAKIADQAIHGYCHQNGLTSWNYTRFIPSPSVDGSYWRPRLVSR